MRRLIIVIVLLLAALSAVAGVYYARVDERYQGYEGEEQFVEISPGQGSRAIGRRLIQAGVVRDDWTFRLAVYLTGTARELKAGEYRFSGPMSAKDVVRKIARGEVHLRPLTFPEGLTIREMAAIFESRGFGAAESFRKAAADPAPIRELDSTAPDLEGYLFPDTYNLPRTVTAAGLVDQMVERFHAVFDEPLRRAAEERELTVRELVTLASLVEKETALGEERPLVAAVYLNRLRVGMPLQADPTVIYGLERAGLYDGNLTRKNLQYDSPYNTYKYRGLPPGPIAAPGRASIEAVLNPAPVDYLYFVSRNDGSHVFATSLAEHNRNVREWQVEFFKRRR
jgi:peptidoglycan lytic transglycosylase G